MIRLGNFCLLNRGWQGFFSLYIYIFGGRGLKWFLWLVFKCSLSYLFGGVDGMFLILWASWTLYLKVFQHLIGTICFNLTVLSRCMFDVRKIWFLRRGWQDPFNFLAEIVFVFLFGLSGFIEKR